jgi:hypothetical protein
MVDLSLDLNKGSGSYQDLLVINNDLVLTSDADPNGANPILQDILQALRAFLGEWYLDSTVGFPWFQQVLIKGAKQQDIDALVQNTILGRPGVQSLLTYSAVANSAKRSLTISFSANTTRGKVSYAGTIVATGGA